MKIAPLPFFAFALVVTLGACTVSAPVRVNSTPSPGFPPNTAIRPATVYLVPQVGDAASVDLTPVASEILPGKGFSIAASPAGAAYAFRSTTLKGVQPSPEPMFSRSDLAGQPVLTRHLIAEFWTLHPDGRPDQRCWKGDARAAGYQFNEPKIEAELLRKLLERFPN